MEEFGALFGAIATAVFLVFMVMAMQFESCRFSIIVMICIPFSLIGSFGLMLLSGVTMSMPSLIGFLMLVGTVINNGILFIDTANQYRSSMDAETALVYAGRSRLRPILMTALTMIFGLFPLMLSSGVGANGNRSLGTGVVGGMTIGTLALLFIVPTLFIAFQWLQERLRPVQSRPTEDWQIEEEIKVSEEEKSKAGKNN